MLPWNAWQRCKFHIDRFGPPTQTAQPGSLEIDPNFRFFFWRYRRKIPLDSVSSAQLRQDLQLVGLLVHLVGRFNGIDTISYSASDGHGGTDQLSFDVTVDPDLLRVSSFAWTDTGYVVRFNHACRPDRGGA